MGRAVIGAAPVTSAGSAETEEKLGQDELLSLKMKKNFVTFMKGFYQIISRNKNLFGTVIEFSQQHNPFISNFI